MYKLPAITTPRSVLSPAGSFDIIKAMAHETGRDILNRMEDNLNLPCVPNTEESMSWTEWKQLVVKRALTELFINVSEIGDDPSELSDFFEHEH